MTLHIQMLQDIATHARAMADSMQSKTYERRMIEWMPV